MLLTVAAEQLAAEFAGQATTVDELNTSSASDDEVGVGADA